GVVGGEAQPAGVQSAPQDLLEAGLVEGRDAGLERRDALGVDVEADDVVAELGHGRGVHGAEVSDSDDGESGGHRDMLLSRGTALPSRRVVRPAGAGAGEVVEPAGAGPDGAVGPTGSAGAAGADGRARAAGSRVAARARAMVRQRGRKASTQARRAVVPDS